LTSDINFTTDDPNNGGITVTTKFYEIIRRILLIFVYLYLMENNVSVKTLMNTYTNRYNKFILKTPKSDGCLDNPYKVDNVIIYFIERNFAQNSLFEYDLKKYIQINYKRQ